MTTLDVTVDSAADQPAAAEPQPGLFGLLGQALFLNEKAYAAVSADRSPFTRGAQVLLTILGVVALARLVGLGLGLLAAPQLGSLQQIVGDFLTGLPWYAQQVQADPQFATDFQTGYQVAWDAIRTLLGVPVPTLVVGLYVSFLLTTLLNWIAYGAVVHVVARWFGGRGRFGQTLGVTALAYAPLLLYVVELVPSAYVPLGLVFAYLLVAKFQAISQAHGLDGVRALAVVLAPYLLAIVVAAGAAIFGAAYGLEQVPYLDQILRVAPQLALLTRIF